MIKFSTASLLILLLTSRADCKTPLAFVNEAGNVAQLTKALDQFANCENETAHQAFLWGSILLSGCLGKNGQFPPRLLVAGQKAFEKQTDNVGTQALQIWWEQSVGSKLSVPDFRHGEVINYITVNYNGKPRRYPVYASPKEEKALYRVEALSQRLLRNQSQVDALLLYRWWDAKAGKLVSVSKIALVAKDENSGFRECAIAELSLREQIQGTPGLWTLKWQKLKKGNVSLLVGCLKQRERELLSEKQ